MSMVVGAVVVFWAFVQKKVLHSLSRNGKVMFGPMTNRNTFVSALFLAQIQKPAPMRVVDKDRRVADDDEHTACAGHCHIETLRVIEEANAVFHVEAHDVERAPAQMWR